MLTWAYKSTLLSTLVTIRYSQPIDTLADLDKSGLPLAIVDDSIEQKAFEIDQRDIMKQIYNRSILFQPNQENEAKYAAMFVTI